MVVDADSKFSLDCSVVNNCANLDIYCNGQCDIECDEMNGIPCPNILCSSNNKEKSEFAANCVA